MQLAAILAQAIQMANSEAESQWQEDWRVGKSMGLGTLAEDFAQECALIRASSFAMATCQVRSLARRVIDTNYR